MNADTQPAAGDAGPAHRPTCREVPRGNGFCDRCAAGHPKLCRYVIPAGISDAIDAFATPQEAASGAVQVQEVALDAARLAGDRKQEPARHYDGVTTHPEFGRVVRVVVDAAWVERGVTLGLACETARLKEQDIDRYRATVEDEPEDKANHKKALVALEAARAVLRTHLSTALAGAERGKL